MRDTIIFIENISKLSYYERGMTIFSVGDAKGNEIIVTKENKEYISIETIGGKNNVDQAINMQELIDNIK